MSTANRLIRPLSILVTLSLTACSGRSDWPSLSCWGEVPPAVADVPSDGAARPYVMPPAPESVADSVSDSGPSGDIDLIYWGERLIRQWQAFEAAVLLIDKAADKDVAMSHWLSAQLELTSVADILTELDDALLDTPDDDAQEVREGWAAALKKASARLEKLKP